MATLTAHRPTNSESTSLSIWKESATRASEWTADPITSSSKKKMVLIPKRSQILVDLERAILTLANGQAEEESVLGAGAMY